MVMEAEIKQRVVIKLMDLIQEVSQIKEMEIMVKMKEMKVMVKNKEMDMELLRIEEYTIEDKII